MEKMEARTPFKGDILPKGHQRYLLTSWFLSQRVLLVLFLPGRHFKGTSPETCGQDLRVCSVRCSGCPNGPVGSTCELMIPRTQMCGIMLMWNLNIQISYRLNNWRNGFGTKAAEALRRYIEVDQAEYFDDNQVIADWVFWWKPTDLSLPLEGVEN